MYKILKIISLLCLIFLKHNLVYSEINEIYVSKDSVNNLIQKKIKDQFSFSGLAAYLNQVRAYVVDAENIEQLKDQDIYLLKPNQSLAVVGRYRIMLSNNIGTPFSFSNEKLILHQIQENELTLNSNNFQVQIISKSDLIKFNENFKKLKYSHLLKPLRILCLGVEKILLWLNSLHIYGWGITIILLSLLFKIFFLPINIILIHIQRKVFKIQNSLENELKEIKLKYSGEEAHNRFIFLHKAKGVTPYYKLKPMFVAFLPIPFLIAIFNVLGEVGQISGKSFFWIKDLAYPDSIFQISFNTPLLGNSLNLLPIIMFIITILSSASYKNKMISATMLNKQKLNLYLMAFIFLFLFYPFPSSMVLYWTFSNIWSAVQQKLIYV
jgi:YidC/Oxa1 family membrane protein insertase